MAKDKTEIINVIEQLVDARDIIFTQIVNLAMSGEMLHITNTFDVGEKYSFVLSHFEGIKDVNVRKLVLLCKRTEKTIFTLMILNGINQNEVKL